MTEEQPIRCLVADDHPAVVEAVSGYLRKNGVDVIATARDGGQALALIESLEPDVAVIDLRMPKVSGTDIALRLERTQRRTKVVVYTGFASRPVLMEAMDAGAKGFVLKEAPLPDLVRAVEVVAAGGSYIDSVVAGAMTAIAGDAAPPSLTQRERQVLRLVANGGSNDEIGKALFISPETVRTHVRRAMAKLAADTRAQAVAEALRQSLIT
jgi:DNA-binding NarL/FixJ family response regulator